MGNGFTFVVAKGTGSIANVFDQFISFESALVYFVLNVSIVHLTFKHLKIGVHAQEDVHGHEGKMSIAEKFIPLLNSMIKGVIEFLFVFSVIV